MNITDECDHNNTLADNIKNITNEIPVTTIQPVVNCNEAPTTESTQEILNLDVKVVEKIQLDNEIINDKDKAVLNKNKNDITVNKSKGHYKNNLLRRRRSHRIRAPIIVNYETIHSPINNNDNPNPVLLPLQNSPSEIRDSGVANFVIETIHEPITDDNVNNNRPHVKLESYLNNNKYTPKDPVHHHTKRVEDDERDHNENHHTESVEGDTRENSSEEYTNNSPPIHTQNNQRKNPSDKLLNYNHNHNNENSDYTQNHNNHSSAIHSKANENVDRSSESEESYPENSNNDEFSSHLQKIREDDSGSTENTSESDEEIRKDRYTDNSQSNEDITLSTNNDSNNSDEVENYNNHNDENNRSNYTLKDNSNINEDNTDYTSHNPVQQNLGNLIITTQSTPLQDVDLADFSYERIRVKENGEVEAVDDTIDSSENNNTKESKQKDATESNEDDVSSKYLLNPATNPVLNLNEQLGKQVKVNAEEIRPVVEINDEESSEEIIDNANLNLNENSLFPSKSSGINSHKQHEQGNVKQEFERIPLNYKHDNNDKEKEKSNDDDKITPIAPEEVIYDDKLNIKFGDVSIKLPDIHLPENVLNFDEDDEKPYVHKENIENNVNSSEDNESKEEYNDQGNDDNDYHSGGYYDESSKENNDDESDEEDEDLYEKFVRERFGKRGSFKSRYRPEKTFERLEAVPLNPKLQDTLKKILNKTKTTSIQAEKSNDPKAGYMWTLEYGQQL